MRKRVDVSQQDMLQLREHGLSNVEIADQLEISVATVYRYIGGSGRRSNTRHTTRTVEVTNKFLFKGHCGGCINVGPGCINCVRNKFLTDNYGEGLK